MTADRVHGRIRAAGLLGLAALAACGSPRAELAGEVNGLPPRSTAFADGTAWLAGTADGMLHAVRVAEDGRLSESTRMPVPGRVDAMAAGAGRLLLAITLDTAEAAGPAAEWRARGWLPGRTSLVVLDVTGAQPRVAGAAAIPSSGEGGARQVVLDGPRAYVVAGGGVWLADVTAPGPPGAAKRVAERGVRVAVVDRHAYVAEGAPGEGPGGLAVLEVAADGGARELGRVDASTLGTSEDGAVQRASVSAVAAADGHVYLGVAVPGRPAPRSYLVAVDVRDPARPRVTARLDADFVDGIEASGRRLYVYGSGGSRALLKVFDVSRPGRPREAASYDVDELTDIASIGALYRAGNLLLLQSDGRGLTVLRLRD